MHMIRTEGIAFSREIILFRETVAEKGARKKPAAHERRGVAQKREEKGPGGRIPTGEKSFYLSETKSPGGDTSCWKVIRIAPGFFYEVEEKEPRGVQP